MACAREDTRLERAAWARALQQRPRRGIATRLGQHALGEVRSLGLRSVVAYTRRTIWPRAA